MAYGNVKVPGLGTYQRGVTQHTTMQPTISDIVRRSQQKRRDPRLGAKTVMALRGGMPPLPSMSRTQPATPSPFGGGMTKPQMYSQLAAAAIGRYAPQRQPNDYSQYGGEAGFRQALQLSPEAYKHLNPETAAWLQMNSEQRALGEQQGWAQRAIDTIQGGAPAGSAAAPPDLEGILGTPGYDEAYWQSRRRKAEADTRQRVAQVRNQLADQHRRGGMSKAYYDNEMAQLMQREKSAVLQSNAELQREQAELTEQARLQHADRYLGRYQTAAPLQQRQDFAAASAMQRYPVAGEAWTGQESYLRGARNDQLAMQLGLSQWGRGGGGGGGGGGGATGVKPYVTWGGRQKITSDRTGIGEQFRRGF
jgi:hypothetical protein